MAATGALEILSLLLLLPVQGLGVPNDLASLIDPADYFVSRRIEGGPKNMIQLAGKPGGAGPGSITQLLAIRWLAENSGQLGEHKDAARQTLEQLAKGPEGFAKDHAVAALAKLDGKPVPILHPMPADSVRAEAFAWFPDDVNFFGALDVRPPKGTGPGQAADRELQKKVNSLLKQGLKAVPGEVKEELYNLADAVGNVRVDRVSAGFAPNPGETRKSRIFVRFTGKADHKRFAEYLAQKIPDVQTEEKKGPRGEPITLFAAKDPPAFALVGDTDLIMAGYESNEPGSIDIVQDVLEVRAGKKPSLLKTPFANDLKRAPAGASAVGGGVIPGELQTALARSPVGAVPLRIFGHVINANATGKGVVLRYQAEMTGEEDAKKLAGNLNDLMGQAVAGLKEAPVPPPFKEEWMAAIRKMLESIEFKAEGKQVSTEIVVSPEVQKVMLNLIEAALKMQGGLEP